MKSNFLFLLLVFTVASMHAQNNLFNLIVGTYTNSCDSKGIYVYDFDSNTADFKLKSTSENVINPSYLTVSKDNKFIYAVNENGVESAVSSFGFNAETGKLSLLNKQSSKGADPCSIINDGKNVIVANYSGGNISVFAKNNDGSISEAKQVVQHSGKGFNPSRQEASHMHMVCFSPDKKYVLANDLGLDKVSVYQYNPNSKNEVLQLKESIAVKPGSGPRHLTFSKDGKFVYLIQELDATLTTFSFDKKGNLRKIAETNILPKGFQGGTGAAAIKISSDGKFLYVTDRVDVNAISVYKILKNGGVELKQQTSTLGKGPRDFTIDPSGNFLLVGNQLTNTIVIFERNKTTGTLTDTGKKIELCAPVCLVFAEK
jgi:6-phosphogluconolactonase